VILDDDLAWVVDYKTGKSSKYADKGQLELMALSLFAKYPQIKTVRAGLLLGKCKLQRRKICGMHVLTGYADATVLSLNVFTTEQTDESTT
jgi:hypothetical protein